MVIEFKPKAPPLPFASRPLVEKMKDPVCRAEFQAASDEINRDQGAKQQMATSPNVKLGRPPTGKAKKAVTIRLDQDVAAALETRDDWRSEVNAVLRKHLGL